jgi:NADH dehydrogenase
MNVVTGAFGYTGKYIARRLLGMGERVRTLTGHPDRPDPLRGRIEVARLAYDNPAELTRALDGASTLYNTYWVRFERGSVTFERAVQNTLTLFRAAVEAGVSRIVHLSITNPSPDSPLPYFRGKAILERALTDLGLSYAIIRPTVIFGREDILMNNITWLLRRFPIFAIPGDGQYRVQPVYVEDVAEIAVTAGHQTADVIVDAAGPETFTYEALVRLIASAMGCKARIIRIPVTMALALSRMLGLILRDVVLTREEINGLMAGLLVSQGPPTGRTRISEWLKKSADTFGTRYASELDRHYRP